MIRKLSRTIAGMLFFLVPICGQGQDLASVQRQLSLFSGILEESLQLNESTGLFGMSLGGVESLYLQTQGAVFEIRSPLANRRNRMGLASLSAAMQSLQIRQNPFQAMTLGADSSLSVQSAQIAESVSAGSAYQQLLDRIAAIDYSAIAQGAMQQASQSARALRALDTLDDSAFAELNAEIGQMRESLDGYLSNLRELERDIRAQLINSNATDNGDSFRDRLDLLLQSLEPLKDQALAKADALRTQAEQAEKDYALAWRRDLEQFQQNLFRTLCEYGDTLDALASEDSISVILKGLGEEQGRIAGPI